MTLHYKEGSTASNTSAKRLKELVDTNGLTVTHIVSPPRTLSTILEIALAEGAHGQVNEPFHTRSRGSFEDGCSNILRRLSSIEGDDPTKRLVIKDLAKHISESEWQKLLCFIRAAIFVIREPTLQFHSLLSVRIADILRDGREAEPHDVAKMAKDLPEEA